MNFSLKRKTVQANVDAVYQLSRLKGLQTEAK